jgi:predicted nucleic acid-binding protein
VSGEFLLDTNVVIAFQAGDEAVSQRLAGAVVFVFAATVGELFYGAYHSQRQMANLSAVDDFCQSVTVLPCDYDTGRFFSDWSRRRCAPAAR